eukprot:6601005-Pyramimonas_sp.AAC.1
MGFPALSCESLWFTLLTVRSERVDLVAGGMSQLTKLVLRPFFGHPNDRDLRRGASFQLPGESSPRLIFGKLHQLIQGEVAHKQ